MIHIKSSSIYFITLSDLKNLEIGSIQHGRIGVIPFYIEDNTKHYIVNTSNRGLLSDFGGGISKKEHIYFDGLKRELSEECPNWTDYIFEKIEQNNQTITDLSSNINNSLQILCREFNNTKTKYILILLQVDKHLIDSFKPTKEVLNLQVLKSYNLYKQVQFNHRLNNGLTQLKLANKGKLITI
jgi:hypothetical protein